MGPCSGSAGTRGGKEALENTREYLRHCRWPHVYHLVDFHLKDLMTDGFPRHSRHIYALKRHKPLVIRGGVNMCSKHISITDDRIFLNYQVRTCYIKD